MVVELEVRGGFPGSSPEGGGSGSCSKRSVLLAGVKGRLMCVVVEVVVGVVVIAAVKPLVVAGQSWVVIFCKSWKVGCCRSSRIRCGSSW